MPVLADLLVLTLVANINCHNGSLASNLTVNVSNYHPLSKAPYETTPTSLQMSHSPQVYLSVAVFGLANAWKPDTRSPEDRHWRVATLDRLV